MSACFRIVIVSVLVVSFFVNFTSSSVAGDFIVRWSPNSENDLAGYRVYYWNNASDVLKLDRVASSIDVSDVTSTILRGLSPYSPYFIAVTAYNQSGLESSFSDIVTIYPEKSCLPGDISGDGYVDISDVMLALRIAVGKVNATSEQLACGDVAPVKNGVVAPNGKIDTGDAIVMLSKVVGKIAF
ncbi:fibronectin type III domain-containing protein [Geobacter pelophilus]|uniref:Fibronectin type III domain-containing protein n=1 Tax=Geoanaerobacter pelophilus TaxID=60036 RepID=A0AAW4KZP0_9BACT|nr:fibronectin type III domain-containing protein [Geoanaerobacter pelophilus]MBT0662705.1 fibronectin type III domain-containing protein [Geoanaerobacter pelophilus]